MKRGLFLFIFLICLVSVCICCPAEDAGEPACSHSGAKYDYNDSGHWKLCPDCGEKLESGSHISQSSAGSFFMITSETHSYQCYCGYIAKASHVWSAPGDGGTAVCKYCGRKKPVSEASSDGESEESPEETGESPSETGDAPEDGESGPASENGESDSPADQSSKAKTSRSAKTTPVPRTAITKFSDVVIICVLRPGGPETVVRLVKLGACRSVVKADRQKYTVSTADITFSEGIPEEQKLAVITASGAPNVKLYKSNKKAYFQTVPVGTIVPVLGFDGKYVQVLYSDHVGYIKSGNISYFRPADPIMTDTVGKKTCTVAVRAKPNRSSRKIASVRSGTEVSIYSETSMWYQVEVEGKIGYMMKQYFLGDES